MKKGICGADCAICPAHEQCRGCAETNGCPMGKQCRIARYIQIGGMERFLELKQQLAAELNALQIPGMARVEELYPLVGSFVNLEYPMPCGKVRLLKDDEMYLGNQLACEFDDNAGRCFGVIADVSFLLVCEYGENVSAPELLVYRKRM